MNANELADEFTNRKDWKLINYIHWSEQSETMLRQLQAENKALKLQNDNYWVMIEILRQKVKAQEK